MNLSEIKAAVDAGKVVHYAMESYTVKRDKLEQYWIVHERGGRIGLTWLDGVTLNGKECDFFIASPYVVQVNHAAVLRTDNIEEVAQYLADNGLEAATNIRNLPDFKHIALSADGDTVCGFVFNNGGN